MSTSNPPQLGRLKALGITEPYLAALYLPKEWDDFRSLLTRFSDQPPEGTTVVAEGMLSGAIHSRAMPAPPRMSGRLMDPDGNTLGFSAFGDTRDLSDEIQRQSEQFGRVQLVGKISYYNGLIYLQSVSLVDRRWVGRLRPKYAGKPKVIKPDSVLEQVGLLISQYVDDTVSYVCRELESSEQEVMAWLGMTHLSLRQLLVAAHYPKAPEQGVLACEKLEALAARRALSQASRTKPSHTIAMPQPLPDWRTYAQGIPFQLSSNQVQAVEEILADIGTGAPMRRLLSGDVGFGKTAVFALAAMCVFNAGGRVVIMLPNEALAKQAFRELTGYWPMLLGHAALVTGTTKTKGNLRHVKFMVGTTALLFKDVGDPTLLVVDEQQKFSREQREKLLSSGTHLLEATATCIPRTQALIQFGGYKQSILNEAPVEKDIRTNIFEVAEKAQLFRNIRETLQSGAQVLVVYPKREEGGSRSDEGAIGDVQTASRAWERLFPGAVRIAHSDLPDEHNEAALRAMRDGHAQILLATTVVEVGVNIPNLRRVVVVQPDRFGLSILHQIRGRVARTGGIGFCDLYLTGPIKVATRERLDVLTKTQDGFEVARQDLLNRGFGNLGKNSDKQSGSDDEFLLGRKLTPQRLEQVLAEYGDLP